MVLPRPVDAGASSSLNRPPRATRPRRQAGASVPGHGRPGLPVRTGSGVPPDSGAEDLLDRVADGIWALARHLVGRVLDLDQAPLGRARCELVLEVPPGLDECRGESG